MQKVLLVEDDIDFGNILKQYLELHQFLVFLAKDGEEALDYLKKEQFTICIFDVMMPKMDGFTLAEKAIEINPEVPFVFLTAKNQSEDKIKGLKLGADDYITKPFEADELVLRLNNIIKRTQRINEKKLSEPIPIGKYLFDTNRYELKMGTKIQQITEKEASLILFFLEHANQLIKRELVLNTVWGNDDYFTGRSMDVFVSRLRKYFKDDDSISLKSIRNIGLEFKIKNADL